MMNDLYNLTPSQIVIYATRICSDCRRAKAFFQTNRIPFTEVNIEGDERATQFVVDINHGHHSVPTIIFPDGSIMVEPTWEELRAKFN